MLESPTEVEKGCGRNVACFGERRSCRTILGHRIGQIGKFVAAFESLLGPENIGLFWVDRA